MCGRKKIDRLVCKSFLVCNDDCPESIPSAWFFSKWTPASHFSWSCPLSQFPFSFPPPTDRKQNLCRQGAQDYMSYMLILSQCQSTEENIWTILWCIPDSVSNLYLPNALETAALMSQLDLENEVSPTVAQPPGTLPSNLHDIADTGTFRKRQECTLWLCLPLTTVGTPGRVV